METNICREWGREKSHGYLCYFDRAFMNTTATDTVGNSTCIVNLTSVSTREPSTEQPTVASVLSNQHEEDKQGIFIIVAAAGGGSVLLVCFIVVALAVRRIRTYKEGKKTSSPQKKPTDDRESAVYGESTAGEYDTICRTKQEKEDHCRHVKDRNLGAKKTDNTYDSMSNIIGSNRSVKMHDICMKVSDKDQTYDHAGRGDKGVSTTLTESIYDKIESNIYDTTDALNYVKRDSTQGNGGGIYDETGADCKRKAETSFLKDRKRDDSCERNVSDIYAKVQKGKPEPNDTDKD